MMKIAITVAIALATAHGLPTTGLGNICAKVEANHGCSPFCGYEAIKAGSDRICMPSGERIPFPFTITKEDEAEYCEMTAQNHGCCDVCGFKFDPMIGECTRTVSENKAKPLGDAPIIGGSGKFRYQYMPNLLQPPAGASMVNCHGLVTDKDNNIILTYQNDGKDQNCLIKWNPDGTGGVFAGGNATLCSGTPHGLKITTEGDTQYLYHANNNQKLTKTTLDGQIVWQVNGLFGQDTTVYRPTWFATPAGSRYNYLCDGYGSNNVYAFDSTNGKFMNETWGGRSPGKGPDQPHGKFQTNHGCTYDPRPTTDANTIVVSDRANSRFEFFHYDPTGYKTFDWYKTVNMVPSMGAATLPCNIRMYPEQEGRAIVPDLSGPVAVLDSNNEVISVVNVSVLLAEQQHKHPHDAIFLPNGDMVVATWAPGRVSYWKLLPTE